MTLLINLAGLLLMVGIVWWFWLSKRNSICSIKP